VTFADLAVSDLGENTVTSFLVGVHIPIGDIALVLDAADRAGYYNFFIITVVNPRWKPTHHVNEMQSRVSSK